MVAVAGVSPVVGELVEGINIPVVNERAVRASAGLLFLAGIVATMIAVLENNYAPLRLFAVVFLLDMALRLLVGTAFAPSLMIGSLLVRKQRPEWVGAAQKKTAWSLALGLGSVSCLMMGAVDAPNATILALCGLCLTMLFAESALGICVGCEIHQRVAKEPPQLCAGDACNYVPPKRGEQHSVLPQSDLVPRAQPPEDAPNF